MSENFEKFSDAIDLGRKTHRTVIQNIILSAAIILVLVVGALADVLNLPGTVIAHETTGFVVIASGLRMMRI